MPVAYSQTYWIDGNTLQVWIESGVYDQIALAATQRGIRLATSDTILEEMSRGPLVSASVKAFIREVKSGSGKMYVSEDPFGAGREDIPDGGEIGLAELTRLENANGGDATLRITVTGLR